MGPPGNPTPIALPLAPMLLSRLAMEELLEFVPGNAVERKMADAKTGACTHDELVAALLAAPLLVASETEVQADGSGFTPLLMRAEGRKLLAAFSSADRLGLYPDRTGHAFELSGREFILRIPPGYGAVVNPGYTHQIIIPPDEIVRFKARLSPVRYA